MSATLRDRRGPAGQLALLGLAVLAAASFLRGFVAQIQGSSAPYWFINYHDGFIRRALLGQVFGIFVGQDDPARVLPLAMYVHLTACAMLLLSLLWWLRANLNSAMCVAAFVLFAGSQFPQTLAFDAGLLDVYAYLLVLAAGAAALKGRFWLAGMIGLVGPFLHDGFIFVWLTLAILVVWRARGSRGTAFLATPFAATAVVYFLASSHAAIEQMGRVPLPDASKDQFIAYQFSQTLVEALRILAWKYTCYFPNFLMAAGFFTLPTMVSLARRERRDKMQARHVCVGVRDVGSRIRADRRLGLIFLVATAFAKPARHSVHGVVARPRLAQTTGHHRLLVRRAWLFRAAARVRVFRRGWIKRARAGGLHRHTRRQGGCHLGCVLFK